VLLELLEASCLNASSKTRKDMRTEIYCEGSLLAAVQNAHLFADSKTFVDMPLKEDADLSSSFDRSPPFSTSTSALRAVAAPS